MVSRAIRPVIWTVVSRVEPPAPYVTETNVGWYGSSVADRRATAGRLRPRRLGGMNSKEMDRSPSRITSPMLRLRPRPCRMCQWTMPDGQRSPATRAASLVARDHLGRGRLPRRHPAGARRVPRRDGDPARPLGPDASRCSTRRAAGLRRQTVPRRLLLLGIPRRAARRRRTSTPCSGPAPPSSCCTPAPWSTTTTWTPPTPGAAGPPRTAAFEAEHRARRLARRPRAVRRVRGDPARRPAAQLGRRAAAPLRAPGRTGVAAALDVFDLCRSEVIAGQFLDVSAQARGRADVDTAMTVLRYKSAKYSIERPAPHRRRPRRRRPRHARRAHGVRTPAGRGVPAPRRPARRVRRRRRHRQAGRRRPGRGQAHGAGRARTRRGPPEDAPRCSTARWVRRSTSTRSRGCGGSSTTPARTPRWSR